MCLPRSSSEQIRSIRLSNTGIASDEAAFGGKVGNFERSAERVCVLGESGELPLAASVGAVTFNFNGMELMRLAAMS
jgi:hypothetical protein